MDGIFQNVIDWDPVLSNRFHTHVKAVVINQPLLELEICAASGSDGMEVYMVNFSFIYVFIIFIFYAFPLVRCIKHKVNPIRIASLFFLFLYTVIIVKTVIFPFYLDDSSIKAGPPIINVIPFISVIGLFTHLSFKTALIQTLGNIALFIPLGFLIPIFNESQKKLLKTIIIIFSVSFSIELVQLFIALITGVPNRITDIDDIILNFIGGIIGYFGYLIVNKYLVPLSQ